MEIRPLTHEEQKYTYSASTQIEGQTGCIGHLRGDFAYSGYGFYTTWFDHRAQWKTEEFKAELDDVINALREDKGLLHNRYDMSAFAKRFPKSAFKGNYCTEFCFRVDTDKYACSAVIPQGAIITFTATVMFGNGLTGTSTEPSRASVLSTRITKKSSVSQTAAKS